MSTLLHTDFDHRDHEYDPRFPDSDGKPMAESTEQFDWIVKIKENLEILFAADPNVFVAGDLMNGWVSPRLEIRFAIETDRELEIYRPDGRRFLTPVELEEQIEQERVRADRAQAELRDIHHKLRALDPDQLHQLGIDLDTLG